LLKSSGFGRTVTGSSKGAELGRVDREVFPDTGNHVKVPARINRPCAAPFTVRLASRGRYYSFLFGDDTPPYTRELFVYSRCIGIFCVYIYSL
jgi:hypothetical protein